MIHTADYHASLTSLKNKIDSFSKLPNGWNFGEGLPIDKNVINIAIALDNLSNAYGFTEKNVFPGVDGEIQFTIYDQEDYLEFTIEHNSLISFVHERNNDVLEYDEDLSLDAIQHKIIQYVKSKLWVISESSIANNTMILKREDSPVYFLSHHLTEVEYPSSKPNAYQKTGYVIATTSIDTIDESHLPQSSFGSSPSINSLKDAISFKTPQIQEMFAITI